MDQAKERGEGSVNMAGQALKTLSLAALSAAAALLLSAGSPGAETVPFNRIQAMELTPTIDGTIEPGEWSEGDVVRLSRAFHEEQGIRLYFAWDRDCLYLAAWVEDGHLWADGNGGGSGNHWEWSNDDSVEWYFDTDNSRENAIMPGDRMLGLNIGNPFDPLSGPGVVSRYAWNRGDGAGGLPGVSGGLPEGLTWAVSHRGTVNVDSDVDEGYSIEVALPWSSLPGGVPADGEYMGINVIVVSDDTGGVRDWSYNRFPDPPSLRFTVPVRLDEYVELRSGRQHGSQSGIWGPVDYQTIQFHSRSDVTSPGSAGSLSTLKVRPYAVRISWTSPGENGEQGVAAGYDVRYSDSPIHAGNFNAAEVAPNSIYPGAPGSVEEMWVMGLAPQTDYWFALRALDEAGNAGPLSLLGPVRTLSPSDIGVQLPAQDYRGAVRVSPSGRYFMTENGANFIPAGYHFLHQERYTRNLYPGEVWTGSSMHDYSADPGALEDFTSYLDDLAASGVTVMRLWLEDFFLPPKDRGNFNGANGAYWVEFPRGTYNAAMGTYLKDLLRHSAERGIHLSIIPFDTYCYMIPDFFRRSAWYTGNGGPLSDVVQFYSNPAALQMAKDRWSWVVQQVKESGYEDAVFGYEIFNEWDGFIFDADPTGALHAEFVRSLAQHVRSLDDEHLILSTNSHYDPRGRFADLSYYDDLFDATMPHFYLAASEIPASNPESFIDTAAAQMHSRLTAWWTLNRLNRKPVLNNEWMPEAMAVYGGNFTEADDESLTRTLWFSELAAGAAGPGLRLQGNVRAASGLLLSDTMLGTLSTLSAFVENGSTSPRFDFTDFPSENWKGHLTVINTSASLVVTGSSDGRKGLVYLLQDRNRSSGNVSGAILRIDGLQTTAAAYTAEFWSTAPNQTAPAHRVEGSLVDGSIEFPIPRFSRDWAVRFMREAATTFFDGSSYVGGGWKRHPLFGYYSDATAPWIFHETHGFMSPTGSGDEGVYFYTADMGWIYTSAELYPTFYRFSDSTWIWYQPGSANPRWFVNLATGQWEQH